jgi:hypothetical protein
MMAAVRDTRVGLSAAGEARAVLDLDGVIFPCEPGVGLGIESSAYGGSAYFARIGFPRGNRGGGGSVTA